MAKSLCCGNEINYIHTCNWYCIPGEKLHVDIMWANPDHPIEVHAATYKTRFDFCCEFTAAFELVSLGPVNEPPERSVEMALRYPKFTQALFITVRWPTHTPEEFYAHAQTA